MPSQAASIEQQQETIRDLARLVRAVPAEIVEALAESPSLARWWESADHAFRWFKPREDRPELFDQQSGFVDAKDVVSFLIAGNASGKTSAAACKAGRFMLTERAPPRKNTPFWILSDTLELVTTVCWEEKLLGEGHLPPSEIQWDKITWYDQKAGLPKYVPLRPWPKERGGDPGKNWRIEFKSYDQQRKGMQARSIGGFWFSEQFPVHIFTEVMVRCREYLYPGGQFCEFTPLEPDLCIWLEKVLEDEPEGWGFYRANTEQNRPNLAVGAIESFMATVPDELVETRLRGALATFAGVIYPSFNVAFHVVDDESITFPPGISFAMGTDWGASVEHPQTTVFGFVDGIGDWTIFDELWSVDQKTLYEHAQDVVARAKAWGYPVKVKYCQPLDKQIDMLIPGWNKELSQTFGLNFCDPARPGNINEWCQYGVPSGPAINDVYDGINEIRALLKIGPASGKPRLRIARRCKHLIEEMRKYRWRKGRRATEGNFLNPAAPVPEPLKRDDDTVDAKRYMIVTFNRFRGNKSPVTTVSRPPPNAPINRSNLSGSRMVPGMFAKPRGR